MPNKRLRLNARFCLLALILAYSTAPIVSRAISDYLTTYAYMLVAVLAFFLIIFSRRMPSINHYVSVLAPFILYQLLTYLTKTDSIIMWGYGVLLFLLPVAVSYYVLYERRDYLPGLSKALRILLIITLITTVIGLIRFPQASRILATIEDTDDAMFITYNWNNIGGYEFIYTLVLLYPLVILAYKQKKLSTAVMVLLAVAIGSVIVLSEYTTALLLFLLSSCLLLVKRDLTTRNLIFFAIAGVLALTLFSNLFSDFLLWLADLFDSETLQERLTALAGGQTGLENSESDRIFLYEKSLETFFTHPILGTMFSGGGGSGGHSQTLDTLAIYGTVGGALMVWMYKHIYTFFLKPFSQEKGFGYVVWFFVQTLMLSTVNTSFWLEVLALYGPLILYAIYRQGEDTNENTVDRQHADRPLG